MAQLTAQRISELFETFLKTHQDKNGNYKYRTRISQMIASGGKSVVVDYEDLMQFNVDLTHQLLQDPDSSYEEFHKAAYETMSAENAAYAEKVRKLLAVRIRGMQDRVPLRKVDTSYLDRLLAVSGMVVRTSELRPLLIDGAFVCPNGHMTMQLQDGQAIKRPVKCEECDESRNLELDQKRSAFIDSQILRIQELPEELPPGQLPQFFDVDLQGDTVNTARPGDRLVLTGIMRAEPDYSPGQGKLRLFHSKIDCNYIEVVGKEPEQVQITKEDELLIRSIATSTDAYQKLVNSISPAIVGHEGVKEAILLLLAGGPQTTLPDGTKLRGDINVLLVGDPGVAKSEMLKFASQVAPRGLFASGRGSTAAGLSAAVIREKNVLMLEAGVVVLADQGIACIDEFDKMRPEDRSALHEQMEQQTITIAKGGIYATLNARTSILAALNPVLGKYNAYQNLTDNINLPIPLLTRFDLIFVIKDTPTASEDEKLAVHILEVHRKRGYTTAPPVQFDLLKKYISYVKKIAPTLTRDAEERLKEYYLSLRRSVLEGQIGATPRTLESLIRLASARARILLREQVSEEDALAAISLMNRMVEDVLTDAETKTKADFGVLLGKPTGERNKRVVAMDAFKALEGTDKKPVERKAFKEELLKSGRFNDEESEKMIQNLIRDGTIYESPKPGFYRRLQA